MRGVTRDGLQVQRDAHGFLVTTEVTVSQGNVTGQVGELKVAIDAASAAAREQELHDFEFSSKAAKAQELKRRLVERWILPMSMLMRLILPPDPELRNTLRSKKYRTYEGAMVIATNLAEHFEKHRARFVAAGLKEETATELRAAVAELQATLAARADHFGRRREATVALEREYARGRKLVRYIDRLLRSEWASTPEKLARWKTLTRFPRAAKANGNTGGATPEVPVSGGNTSTQPNAA